MQCATWGNLMHGLIEPLPELPVLWSCDKGVIGSLLYARVTRKILDLKAQPVRTDCLN